MSDLITVTGPLVDHQGATPLAGVTVTATPSRDITRTSDGEDALTGAAATTDETGTFELELVYAAGLRYLIQYRVQGKVLRPYTLDCDSWAAGSTVTIQQLPPIAGVPPSAVEDLQAWFLDNALPGVPGPEGPAGPVGPAGPEGESIYDVWLAAGNVGTEADFLADMGGVPGPEGPAGPQGPQGEVGPVGPQGPEGPQGPAGTDGATGPEGPQGDPGPANTLTIGTVSTLAAGASATAAITGTAPDQTLSLGIPQGVAGSPTAYELRGTGMPNGVVTASPGTYYTDTAGTNGAWRWLKKTGTGNTGWRVVHGDTGWRNVATYLDPMWSTTAIVGGFCRIRRVNNTAYTRMAVGIASGAPGVGSGRGANRVLLTDVGMSMVGVGSNYSNILAVSASTTNLINLLRSYPATLRTTGGSGTWTAGDSLSFEIVEHVGSDDWPTTLPGTAA